MSTLLIFDTSYLYFRAFFGVPDTFRSPQGHPVNAVRGTLDSISRLVSQYSPDVVACAWDEDWRPQWRVDLIPSYKTHRLAADDTEEVDQALARQVPWIRRALETAGIPIIGAEQHEADDVLASLARHHHGHTYVATGDRDLFQLVCDSTSVIYLARGVAKHELITAKLLADTYSVPVGRYVDFAVLRGDPSDGLPGVKGVGEKTAAALVNQYPSLELMLAAAEDPSSGMARGLRAKLLAAADYLPKAHQVVTCVDTLQLPTPSLLPIDQEGIESLTEELGLGGSLRRVAAALSSISPR